MRVINIQNLVFGLILHSTIQVNASRHQVRLSSDGPVVRGGLITFKAELFESDGSRPSGPFSYSWRDNALHEHHWEITTTNTTCYWSISYPAKDYASGTYRVEVTVEYRSIFWFSFGRDLIEIEVTDLLNGNITTKQSNKSLENDYVSSKSETEIEVSLRKGDYDYIASKATSISTFWFIDCKHYGQSSDLKFNYNFTEPDTSRVIEALIVASFDPPTTTTTIAPTTSIPSANTLDPNITTIIPITTTSSKPMIISTDLNTTKIVNIHNETNLSFGNNSFPYICRNSSIIPPDPHKTYGYFTKEVKVRAPISDITVDGTPWLQPWEMLSLNVSCKGSGPFSKCLLVNPGQYNVTGNETCKENDHLESCSFPIIHYFLDPGVYTIVVILNNAVSKQIYPLTINIYTVTTKPQLSVIIVPVSCSLAAVVLIVFGVAYYVQSKERFTVEVADFDFGQHNPEMEYKTFTERLRDSVKQALQPRGGGGGGGDGISAYEQLDKPLLG